MAHDHHDITPPRAFEVPKGFNIACAIMFLLGFGTFVVAQLMGWGHHAWNGYLVGFWFTLSLALSGPFFVATQHLSIAGWSMSIRRIPEAFGAFLLPAFIFAIGGLVGGDHLFHWFDLEYVAADPILSKKEGFLNPTAFAVVTVVTFVIWNAIYFWMRRNSVRQDEEGGYSRSSTHKVISTLFLVAFVIGFSMQSWYWIMSLEPHWFSTMFSVYTFAGLFQSGLALMAIVTLYFKERGDFGDFVGTRQIHDLGQLLFGFTVFYAYIGFSQFLLIWYANIPEEAIWYVARGTAPDVATGWEWATLALPVLKFIVPFFVLLPQANKKNHLNILKYVAYGLLFLQLYEVWYWVAPTPHGLGELAAEVHVPLIEILISIGFIGAFGYTVARALASANLVPVKDPFLHEAMDHHHHGVAPPNPDRIKIS